MWSGWCGRWREPVAGSREPVAGSWERRVRVRAPLRQDRMQEGARRSQDSGTDQMSEWAPALRASERDLHPIEQKRLPGAPKACGSKEGTFGAAVTARLKPCRNTKLVAVIRTVLFSYRAVFTIEIFVGRCATDSPAGGPSTARRGAGLSPGRSVAALRSG